MDYIVREFGHATSWNHDNSYSFLTATSDALLSFETPQTATFHISSLSTSNFATSYTLSALGQLDGSLSYLYSNVDLGHVRSKSRMVSLRQIVEGYRNVPLPVRLEELGRSIEEEDRKKKKKRPTLLHATLILPPPSTLTALYARRVQPETLLSIFLDSRSVTSSGVPSPPPATVLAHIQRDTGRYSLEGLGSTDSGLLGIRGLWNFGLGSAESLPGKDRALSELGGSPDIFLSSEQLDQCSAHFRHLASKPSLLSAGAEFYYSPFSHVIGLSTGLRFTTLGVTASNSTSSSNRSPAASKLKSRSVNRPLAGTSAALSSAILTPANVAHSSFPYTMTLTANPIIGSLSTTYSVKPSSNLALSSRFNFNIYSWESQYVIGAEIWRRTGVKGTTQREAGYTAAHNSSLIDDNNHIPPQSRSEQSSAIPSHQVSPNNPRAADETVIKMRLDDNLNVKLLWTGRVKDLLVSAGVSVSPVAQGRGLPVADEEGRVKRWTGRVGVSLAYST